MRKCRKIGFQILAACMVVMLSGCNFSWQKEALQQGTTHLVGMENAVLRANADMSENIAAKEQDAKEENKDSQPGVTEEVAEEENKDSQPEITEFVKEILEKTTKKLSGEYPVDDSFLLWLAGQYGREILYRLQEAVCEEPQQMESWYEITGKSIHVLWIEYCRDMNIQESYLEKVYEKECSEQNKVVMDFTGDINLAEGWPTTQYLDGKSGGIRDCFSHELWEEMQSADILMINNEFTFSNRGTPLAGKAYTFRADPARISAIQEMGTDILSLANNHVYDYGEEALLDTLDTVEQAEIPYVGAGRNLQEAMKPVYFIANGRKIAIVSATQIERSTNYTKEATDTAAGVLKTLNPDKFLSVIEKARACSDYVIAFVHWGTENTNYYGSDQEELGRLFIEAGADVIIGGHTHCLQGFAYYNGKPIIYSLGNFWFNGRSIDTGLSQLVIHTDSNQLEFRFLPCKQRGCVTSLVGEGERARILEFMQKISSSGVSVGEDGIITEVP